MTTLGSGTGTISPLVPEENPAPAPICPVPAPEKKLILASSLLVRLDESLSVVAEPEADE